MGSIGTSLRLTGASFRLVFRNPKVFLLPVGTLAWVIALIVGPISFFVWWGENYPSASVAFWKGVFFLTVQAYERGDWAGMVWSAILTGYIIWGIWMTFALTGVLFFTTVGMDVATQQIRKRASSLGAAFGLAARNLHRIFLIALVNATLVAWFKYFTTFVLRLVPFVGRIVNRVFRLVLTAVTYLMLPIVIYERAGPINALKSAWRNVRKTWSGLLVGTGTIFGAVFVLFELIAWPVFQAALGTESLDVAAYISLAVAAILFAIASAVAAAMRATLYWYATTGEVPEGFQKDDLPQIAGGPHPFTTMAATAMVAAPSAPSRTPSPASASPPARPVAKPATRVAPAKPAAVKPSTKPAEKR